VQALRCGGRDEVGGSRRRHTPRDEFLHAPLPAGAQWRPVRRIPCWMLRSPMKPLLNFKEPFETPTEAA
jgi:hypothetical protein